MRQRESWQHEWFTAFRVKRIGVGAEGVVKVCVRPGCAWEMLSRKNRNRYRNGPDGAWQHSPKDCKGEQG